MVLGALCEAFVCLKAIDVIDKTASRVSRQPNTVKKRRSKKRRCKKV